MRKHKGPWEKGFRPPPHFMRDKNKRGCFILFGFVAVFGMIVLLIAGGFGVMAFIVSRIQEGGHKPEPNVWMMGCGITTGLVILAVVLGSWARRNIANPLANVLEAADAVSEGDLSVRVPLSHRGRFYQLEISFNRMLEELERADLQRRNLTADVAHELRTPLHVIQGYLEGVLDGVYQPDEDTINLLLDETHLLSRLVEDLRTLSLAEAGELQLQLEEVNLAELIADVRTSFSGQAEAAGINLTTRVEESLTLTADPGRLDQVLSNLVVNALRHTPEGGEVSIQADQEQDALRIVVEDNGEGISSEDIPFIFDRFWKADKSRQHTDDAGHGLGLAIARQLIRAHGGEIRVESELGQGTKFTIELPNK